MSAPGSAIVFDDAVLPPWLAGLAEKMRGIEARDLSAFVPPQNSSLPAPRESAVLVLFGEGPDGPDVTLTERAHTMRSQPGQVSFPGGALDPEEDAVAAAQREAVEEIGLEPSSLEIFAVLPRVWLPPRNFAVAPVLGFWDHPHPVEVVNPAEVHEVFRAPIEQLLDPARRFTVRHPVGWTGPGWMLGKSQDVLLWGFTAGVLDAIFDYVGWTRRWDRDEIRELPDDQVDWRRVAEVFGTDLTDLTGHVDPHLTLDPARSRAQQAARAEPPGGDHPKNRSDTRRDVQPHTRGDADRDHRPAS